MTENRDRSQLEDLARRLENERKETLGETTQSPLTAGETGWRMVTELVAGIILGALIGYGFDSLFNTIPFFLFIFCMLGFAAGIRVVMRTAQTLSTKNEEEQRSQE